MNDELNNKNHCGCGESHCEPEHTGCDCGCEHDESPMVYFEQEDGTEVAMPIIDSFSFEDCEYVVVEDNDEEAWYIFEVVENEGEEVLEPLSEEKFEKVSAYYDELLAEDEEEAKEDEDND